MRNILQYTLLLFLLSIPVCSLMVMVYYAMYYPEHFSWREAPILALTLAVYYLALRRPKFGCVGDKGVIAASFIVANVAMGISLLAFDTEPCSDYIAIYDMAHDMAHGTFDIRDFPHFHYVYIFNYQAGIAAFVSLIFLIFGCHFWILQILNLLVINLTLWLTYKVAIMLCGHRAAVTALALMATYFPVLITVNQFTNQHVVTPLILLTLIALSRQKWYWWLLAGILAGITNVLRPMGIILMLSAVVYAICRIGGHWRDIQCISTSLVMILTFVGAYVCCNAAFDSLFISLNYTDCPIGHTRLTFFKFDKGLTGYDYPAVRDFESIEAFNRWEKDRLIHKLSDEPLEVISYVSTKMVRYLGEYDWKFENTYNHNPKVYNHYPVKGWVMLGWGQYIVMALLAIIGYCRWRRTHGVDAFQIFYVGITVVYIFIEAFSSYRYESYPILLTFAAYGVVTIRLKRVL